MGKREQNVSLSDMIEYLFAPHKIFRFVLSTAKSFFNFIIQDETGVEILAEISYPSK